MGIEGATLCSPLCLFRDRHLAQAIDRCRPGIRIESASSVASSPAAVLRSNVSRISQLRFVQKVMLLAGSSGYYCYSAASAVDLPVAIFLGLSNLRP